MDRCTKSLVFASLLCLTGCLSESPQSNDPTLCQFESGACAKELLALDITPRHAPSETLLNLSVSLPDGFKVLDARVEGRDMFMGTIPVRFNSAGKAEVIYGSCSSGYMVWRLWLTLEKKDGTQVSRHFDWLADNDQG